MATAAAYTYLTPADYLAFEREADIKHEYCNGQLYAMSGASRAHNLISLNIAGELRAQLKRRPCEVYMSEMRVLVDAARSYRYPDVVVACDAPRFQDDVFDTLLNPTVIVEVLSQSTEARDLSVGETSRSRQTLRSQSTEARDRGEKFAEYAQLVSLRDYVLVAQKAVHVEHYLREGTRWVSRDCRDLAEVLQLESIGCALPLRDIYEKVKVPMSPKM